MHFIEFIKTHKIKSISNILSLSMKIIFIQDTNFARTYIFLKICNKNLLHLKMVFRAKDDLLDDDSYDADNNDISAITPLMHTWRSPMYTPI